MSTPAPTAPAPVRDYCDLPLDQLEESEHNTRTHYDPAKLAELAASFTDSGVIEPIIVRPARGAPDALRRFEILAGSRRFRAAKLAQLEHVPAVIRHHLTDAQALRITLIENAQREDVHPLDEAKAFAKLMDKKLMGNDAMTAEQIAESIGKSKEFVWARLKLNSLGERAAKVFREEALPAEHATNIARLAEGDQKKVVQWCLQERQHDGRFPSVGTIRAYVEDEVRNANARQQIANKLAEAKQNKERAVMISAHNSWYGPSSNVAVIHRVVWADQYKPAGDKVCSAIAIGVSVDRESVAEVMQVCDNPACQTHWPQPTASKKKKTKKKTKDPSGTVSRGIDDPEIRRLHEAREAAKNRAIGLVLSKAKFDAEDLRFIAYALTEDIASDEMDAILARRKAPDAELDWLIDKAKGTDALLRLILEMAFFSNYYQEAFPGEPIERLAKFEKRYGINMEKFEQEALAALEAKEAAPPVQTSTVKPAKKSKASKAAKPKAAKRKK